MSTFDWIVLWVTIATIVGYGVWKTRGSQSMESFFKGDNEAKWWTVGLSVMATQASAITFLSTPGQAYNDGMGFAQFYFMLPVAMIIICITFIPLFYKLKVYTAYEFLESRFDLKTRSLTAALFLVQRGLAAGITIYAPAIILSSVLGWELNHTCVLIGTLVLIYTFSGGTKAVNVTHKLQMSIIFTSLFIVFFILLSYMPEEYSFRETLQIANANDKLEIVDFSFDWKDRYNIWTSLAAVFLFLSYFGTDQSQVQRYLSGQSVRQSRLGLLFNGMLKVPLQFFILFLGVLVFMFFQFNKAPVFFNESVKERIYKDASLDIQEDFTKVETKYNLLFEERKEANQAYVLANRGGEALAIQTTKSRIQEIYEEEKKLRNEAKTVIKRFDNDIETNDKDYVFMNFILNHLPNGLTGLLLSVIFFAAMSSTAAELNALASTTTVDIYKRSIVKDASEAHYLMASRGWTLFWGIVAILFASFGTLFENLIQFVNIIGSIFYGTILGVFLIAFYIKRLGANATFFGAMVAELAVIWVWYNYIFVEEHLSFLWLNIIGCLLTILIATLLSLFGIDRQKKPA